MDINATLRECRELAAALIEQIGRFSLEDELVHNASELAEHFEELDNWLCKVGYLPADWAYGRVAQ